MKKILLLLLFVSLNSLFADTVELESKYLEIKDDINIFYSSTCSHCHDLMDFLAIVEKSNPGLKINYFEIREPENKDNYDLFLYFCSMYETGITGVPRMFVNNTPYVGYRDEYCDSEFNDVYKAYILCENQVEAELSEWANANGIKYNFISEEEPLNLSVLFIFLLIIILYGISYFIFKKRLKGDSFKLWLSGLFILCIVLFFFLIFFLPESMITGFASKLPFPVFVVIIALADGFNPCAFAVLFILLSLLTHAEKKRQMSIIGIIFIITSAVIYFIFILITITAGSFFVDSFGRDIILRILGVVVTIVGLINIKDFVFFKKGISMSISDKEKLNFSKKAAGIVKYLKNGSVFGFISAIAATILLGISVNIIELGCSAILPVIYMTALINHFGEQLGFAHILWTINYALIYVIPMIAILFWFIFTFKSRRLSESKGKLLKLFGGIVMVTCGIILIIKPYVLFFN